MQTNDLTHPNCSFPKEQYSMLDPKLKDFKWSIRTGDESNYMRLQILLNLYGFPYDNPFENYSDVEWYPYINYTSTFDTFENVVFPSVTMDVRGQFFETVEELAKAFEQRVH